MKIILSRASGLLAIFLMVTIGESSVPEAFAVGCLVTIMEISIEIYRDIHEMQAQKGREDV